MTRRTVFPALAAGLLAPRVALAAANCNPNRFNYPDYLNPALYHGAPDWKPVKLTQRERPLWSKMSREQKDKVRTTLSQAYPHLASLTSGGYGWQVGTWVGQGRLHDYFCSTLDVHLTSSFLPWHRAFTFFHEQLLQTFDKDFMLPVWDWENCKDTPDAYEGWLPLPPTVALNCGLTRDKVQIPIDACMLQSWLLSDNPQEFLGHPQSDMVGGNAFGGPHQLIHGSTGPFMSEAKYAALDPLFFAHHANMDRFFYAWWDYYKRHGFQAASLQWPVEDWYFYDPKAGCTVKVRSNDFAARYLEDIHSLGYTYSELPKLSLWDFDSIPALSVHGAIRLYPAQLLKFLSSLKALMPSAASGAKLLGLLADAARLSSEGLANVLDEVLLLFDQTIGKLGTALPLHAAITVPADSKRGITPGKYYAVGFQPAGSKDPVPAAGGFGVFAHLHENEWSTPLALCLNPASFRSLLDPGLRKGVRLVYGLPSFVVDGAASGQFVTNPQPVTQLLRFEIRYPKDLSILTPKG